MQLSAELGQLTWDAVVERVVGRDDGHGRVPATLSLPQPIEKPQAVDERHPQVDDDCVGIEDVGLLESGFRVERGPHLVTLEAQNLRKRLRHRFVVVDDQHS